MKTGNSTTSKRVSFLNALLILLLVGGMVGLCGVGAGVDPGTLKFGLMAFLFLAIPIVLASFVDVEANSTAHRSFRPTPLSYMQGKRVKPNLWHVASVWQATALASAAGVLLVAFSLEAWFHLLSSYGPPLAGLVILASLLAYTAARTVVAIGSAHLGYVTRHEAWEYISHGRRWPETWLEPIESQAQK